MMTYIKSMDIKLLEIIENNIFYLYYGNEILIPISMLNDG